MFPIDDVIMYGVDKIGTPQNAVNDNYLSNAIYEMISWASRKKDLT